MPPDPAERQVKSDQSVFDRDPCDGCDGTCGDVCPVMEAQRHALERVQSRSEIRRDAVMDPVGLAHRHAEVVIERDRLRAEVTHLKEEQVAFVRALEKAQAENERLRVEIAALGKRASAADVPCGCKQTCGDDGDIDGPGTCKDLPMKREPLVELITVRRSARASDEDGAS